MRKITEVEYPVTMQFELRMDVHEVLADWQGPLDSRSRHVKVIDSEERTFWTAVLSVDIRVVLLHFHDRCYVYPDELKEEAISRKLRALEFHEYLALRMKRPEEIAGMTIVVPESAFHMNVGGQLFKYCLEANLRRSLSLEWRTPVPIKKTDWYATAGDPQFFFAFARL